MRAGMSAALSFVLWVVVSGPVRAEQATAATPERHLIPLAVASIEMEEAKLENVGVFAWFKPSQKDLLSIREFLERDITPYAPVTREVGKDPLKIWIVIRRYLLVTTSDSGDALVSVAWCAAYSSEHIVFHEEFYAAKHKFSWLPKGDVHKAIARRIAETARQLAFAEQGSQLKPVTVENTFLEFNEATEHVPVVRKAFVREKLVWTNGYMSLYSGTATNVNWDWAQHPDRINWREYIARSEAAKIDKTVRE